MTKIKLWASIVAKYPSFGGDNQQAEITLRVKGIRAFFDKVYDDAHSQGEINGRALEKIEAEKQNKKSPYEDILGGIFGGKK